MAPPAHKLLTYQDYLDLEASTGVRHEFLDGVAVAMAGGSIRHAMLQTDLAFHMQMSLRGAGACRAVGSELKVRSLTLDFASYPDLSVVCGPVVPHPNDPHAMTNPRLLAEVLSPSTEGYDRGDKFDHYRSIATLEHYVLVSTNVTRVELFSRQPDATWTLRVFGPGQALVVEDMGIEVAVDDLYRDLPEEETATD